ncbi:hypothetical protein [Brevibacillus agri]|uniref:hypothetical protein n=1 Tax=Brevibacillus agri TaxID=51101 RepID=UPI0035E3F1A2
MRLLLETIVVPVHNVMKRVPVLTTVHLRVYKMLENGIEINTIAADRQMRRAVNDLCRLGWVKASGDRN